MSKEITKAYILQQLQDKFGLREFEPAKFLFDETVIPVYDIAPHTLYHTARYNIVSVTAGPAGYLVKSVPDTERWTLRGYNVIFMAAGAYKVTGIYITRKLQVIANAFVYLDMTLGQTVSYAVNLPTPVVLEPGDEISVYIDDYTSTANLRVYIDYTVEELR